MEHHHPIMSKLRDLGGQTYRQTDINSDTVISHTNISTQTKI